MSASLVGSEMCIRDRSRSAPPGAPAGAASSPRPRSPRSWGARAGSARGACLLYTSDAADDM
eukprot:3362814-Alexandrium_andersonii.AAC.1